jgi:hypothetical protein
MDESSRQILKQYTLDALSILEHSVWLYEQGHHSFYRVAATQLRILLCDTTFRHDHQQDISIIPILVPGLRLHIFSETQSITPEVDLQTWLDSPAGMQTDLSVRQLIRRICDIDGGAHVDIKPLAGLPVNADTRQWIIQISKYLLPILTAAITD